MGGGSAMPRFFVEKSAVEGARIIIDGEDAKHISLSLRAKVGEKITACDGQGTDYECEIAEITRDSVLLKILEEKRCGAEPSVEVTLYQALAKSDKFDFIVQKCVELGVAKIVPVVTERCVSKPDDASLSKKTARWNKISKEAAKQSGRGAIPEVCDAVSFNEALELMSKDDLCFVCYESTPRRPVTEVYEDALKRADVKTISFLIGPEGGISEKEILSAEDKGVSLAGLGPRILRTETAPLCVLSALMLMSGNLS